MSNRRLLDTNVIVRFLVQDDASLALDAQRLFTAASEGRLKLLLLSPVLAEVVFVLESFYGRSRTEIAEKLSILITSPGIDLEDRNVLLDALERYCRVNLHFIDCIIAATSLALKLPVATFDARLKKLCRSDDEVPH